MVVRKTTGRHRQDNRLEAVLPKEGLDGAGPCDEDRREQNAADQKNREGGATI